MVVLQGVMSSPLLSLTDESLERCRRRTAAASPHQKVHRPSASATAPPALPPRPRPRPRRELMAGSPARSAPSVRLRPLPSPLYRADHPHAPARSPPAGPRERGRRLRLHRGRPHQSPLRCVRPSPPHPALAREADSSFRAQVRPETDPAERALQRQSAPQRRGQVRAVRERRQALRPGQGAPSSLPLESRTSCDEQAKLTPSAARPQDTEATALASTLQQALVPAILLEHMPKSQIDLFVTVLESDGWDGDLSMCVARSLASLALLVGGQLIEDELRVVAFVTYRGVTAASTALAEAGIPMRGLVTGCSAVRPVPLLLLAPAWTSLTPLLTGSPPLSLFFLLSLLCLHPDRPARPPRPNPPRSARRPVVPHPLVPPRPRHVDERARQRCRRSAESLRGASPRPSPRPSPRLARSRSRTTR